MRLLATTNGIWYSGAQVYLYAFRQIAHCGGERGHILYFADGNSPSYVEVLCGSRMGNSGEGDIALVLIPSNDLLRHPISNRVFHITKRLAKRHEIFYSVGFKYA